MAIKASELLKQYNFEQEKKEQEKQKKQDRFTIKAKDLLDIYNYEDEYINRVYNDNFGGQFKANAALGTLMQDSAQQWKEYLDDPTETNRLRAENIDKIITQFQENNQEALDDENARLPWLSKSLAGYLPQFIDQTKAGLGGALMGGGGGAAVGSVVPGIGTATGFAWGARAGYVAGTTKQSYDIMQGYAFKELIDLGVPEDIAIKVAQDEAVLSSLVEGLGSVVDVATLGIGKGFSAIGKALFKKGAKTAAEKKISDSIIKALGEYGINIVSEAAEEGAQQIVSLANQDRALNGNTDGGVLDLAQASVDKAGNLSPEELQEIIDSAKEGAKISAMLGGGVKLINTGLDRVLNRTPQQQSQSGLNLPPQFTQETEQQQTQQDAAQQQTQQQTQQTAEERFIIFDNSNEIFKKNIAAPYIANKYGGEINFSNAVMRQNPDMNEAQAYVAMAQEIRNYIDNTDFAGKDAKKEKANIQKLPQLQQVEQNTGWEQVTGDTDLNNYSIVSVPGTNKQYVKADRQVISGDDPKQWGRDVENYINEQIRQGKDVQVTAADGDVLTITKDSAGKAKFRNEVTMADGTKRSMTNEEYRAKLNAESHVDELAQVSRRGKNIVPDAKNHPFAKDGFNYRTAYFEDFDGQYYKITMSVGLDGEIKTIYNVGRMKTQKAPTSRHSTNAATFNEELSGSKAEGSGAFDDANIPQKSGSVNRNFMQDGENYTSYPQNNEKQKAPYSFGFKPTRDSKVKNNDAFYDTTISQDNTGVNRNFMQDGENYTLNTQNNEGGNSNGSDLSDGRRGRIFDVDSGEQSREISGGTGQNTQAKTGTAASGRSGRTKTQSYDRRNNNGENAPFDTGRNEQEQKRNSKRKKIDDYYLVVVPIREYTQEMKEFQKEVRNIGLKDIIYFKGEGRDSKGQVFRGAYNPDSQRIYVQTDNSQYSIKQIFEHEIFHVLVQKDKNLIKRIKDRIRKEFPDDMSLEALFDVYKEKYQSAYADRRNTEDKIYEEIFADIYSDIMPSQLEKIVQNEANFARENAKHGIVRTVNDEESEHSLNIKKISDSHRAPISKERVQLKDANQKFSDNTVPQDDSTVNNNSMQNDVKNSSDSDKNLGKTGEVSRTDDDNSSYSLDDDDISTEANIKEQLQSAQAKLNELQPVTAIEKKSQKGISRKEQLNALLNAFQSMGIYDNRRQGVEKAGFGFIEMNKEQIDKGLKYVNTDAEYAAFFAVPYVLRKGIKIGVHNNHKDRFYDTVTFAAPVTINGTRTNVAVVVKTTGKNTYKAHRVMLPDGKAFILETQKDTEPTTGDITVPSGNSQRPPISSASETNITQKERAVKENLEKTREVSRTDDDNSSYSLANNKKPNVNKAVKELKDIVDERRNSENPDSDTLSLPPMKSSNKQNLKGDGESKFAQSLQNSKLINDDIKEKIQNDSYITSYDVISNKKTMDDAYAQIVKDPERAVERFSTISANEATPQDFAIGFILMDRYQRAGMYKSAIATMEKLRAIGTKSGQMVQMFSLLGRLTPTGMLRYAEKSLDTAWEEIKKKKSKAWCDKYEDSFKLTEREQESIVRNVIFASQLPNGRDKTIILAGISQMIADKMPKSLGIKIATLARISMLFNTKTQVRNVLGNASIFPVQILSDFIGTGIDKRIGEKTGVRTVGTFSSRAFVQGAKKGFFDSFDDFRRKINTRGLDGDRFEVGTGKVFREQGIFKGAVGRALNSLDRTLTFMLDAGDRPFFETWFINSLNNQMRLNKVDTPTASMIEIAKQEALERTWQDDNKFANTVKTLRRLMNFNHDYGLGTIILPFVKTPANLIRATVAFSPIGLLHGLATKAVVFRNALSKGEATPLMQRELVKALSQGITGTLIMLITGALAAKGMLTGEDDDDYDVANFEKNILGIYPYSVRIGNTSFSYDWMQPLGSSAAIMADFIKGLKEENASGFFDEAIFGEKAQVLNSLLNALKSGGNVIYEQSFMRSISDLFGYDGLMAGVLNVIISEPAKFIPTAFGQAASLGDDTVRSSYVSGDLVQTAINKVMYKIPGLRNDLPASIDQLGREKENNNSVLNVFFNPAITTSANTNAVADEMYRLYKATGETSAIPSSSTSSFAVNGSTLRLNGKQKEQYQKVYGQTAAEAIDDLINLPAYQDLEDNIKLNIFEDIYGYSTASAKAAVSDYELPKEYQKYVEAEDNGISAAMYAYYLNIANIDGSGGITQAEAKETIDDMILTKAQKAALWTLTNSGWSEKNNPYK